MIKRLNFLNFIVVLCLAVLITSENKAFSLEQSYSELYYMGIAGSYSEADLDNNFNPKASEGINFRSGTTYTNWFSAELNIDYFLKFKGDSLTYDNQTVNPDLEHEVISFTMDAKVMPYIGLKNIRPFVLVGAGWMISKARVRNNAKDYLNSLNMDGSDYCVDIRYGIDYRLSNTYSFDATGGYIMGYGDVKDINIRFYSIGISYHF